MCTLETGKLKVSENHYVGLESDHREDSAFLSLPPKDKIPGGSLNMQQEGYSQG